MQPIRLHTHEQPQHLQGCPTYRQSGACFPADDKLANRSRKSPLKIVNGRNAYRGPFGPFLESNEDRSIHSQRWQAEPTPMGSLGNRVRPNGKLGKERKERRAKTSDCRGSTFPCRAINYFASRAEKPACLYLGPCGANSMCNLYRMSSAPDEHARPVLS